jgi:hypothetical protein
VTPPGTMFAPIGVLGVMFSWDAAMDNPRLPLAAGFVVRHSRQRLRSHALMRRAEPRMP